MIDPNLDLVALQRAGEAPLWMGDEGLSTLQGGYMLPGETPRGMYLRVARAASLYYGTAAAQWEARFFDAMWKNWLCPASPVLSNMGTDRGLPISCNSIHVDDSVDSIFQKNHELAILSKNGAGVGVYMGDVRHRGAPIRGNGSSEGVIPWSKVYDVTTSSVSQGTTRRGACALYLPVTHPDAEEFLQMRRPIGDLNRRCLNVHHGFTLSDKWMQSLVAGDAHKRKMWAEILRARVETGEPYLFFEDAVNRSNPPAYRDRGMVIKTSNICTEITLYTDTEHSFVCCLSSLNLVRWEEWKDSTLVETTVRFLDAVLSEYILKSEGVTGLEASRRSALAGRALGIGVLGWHSLLQERGLPFDSFGAMSLNAEIFRTLRRKAEEESAVMARELGEPSWCQGHGRRHTHLLAVAPTVSNSAISGGQSAGIEPLAANIFSLKSAKGTFIRKNHTLRRLLASRDLDTPAVWKSINEFSGSVQHLDVLSADEKQIFLTAREINQHAIVKQAGQRQRWIDQSQSVNLFFASNSTPQYIHEVHLAAWEEGLKTLYYLRTEGVLRGDLASRSKAECSACEG
jgi:ribonucleoside-diphosphate reductase alpha chain